jgi:hypothetical protein
VLIGSPSGCVHWVSIPVNPEAVSGELPVRHTASPTGTVDAPSTPVRTLGPGDLLQAPGILRNPVPVEALYDREAGHGATLRNLLQRQGYADLDDVLDRGRREGEAKGRAEGAAKGRAHAVIKLLRGRGLDVPTELEAEILACRDLDRLDRWLLAAARVDRAADLNEGPEP